MPYFFKIKLICKETKRSEQIFPLYVEGGGVFELKMWKLLEIAFHMGFHACTTTTTPNDECDSVDKQADHFAEYEIVCRRSAEG